MISLVTRGAGFIGSHLTDRLLAIGDEVIVLDAFTTGRRGNLASVATNSNLNVIEGSVCDGALVDEVVAQADRVFHLAAAVGVREILERPRESFNTNVLGSMHVIDAATSGLKPLLVTSSSEVYGRNPASPLTEDTDRLVGSPQVHRWSYSQEKACEEFLAHVAHEATGAPVATVRLFNTVGPRQVGSYGMVLPNFIRQALADEPLTVFGDGRQTRCFTYVGDVVDALVELIETPAASGEVFNIGGAEEISMSDLARRVVAIVGSSSRLELIDYKDAYGAGFEDTPRRVPDISRVDALIGWRPTHTLDDIISKVASAQSHTTSAEP